MYSTGSGDYVALMAAVLAHAVADGWTTSGGTWPISKGNVKGVDWSTFTVTEPDRTFLGGASRTTRYVRISVGNSLANSTTNAALIASSATVANMHQTFTSWHIFSDSGVGKPNYIHVVVNFSNGVNGDCYTHFSFGELDKHGMGHTAIIYASSSPKRGWAIDTLSGTNSSDWNSGMYGRTLSPYTGRAQFTFPTSYNGLNNLVYIIDPLISPVPASGWPAANDLQNGSNVIHSYQVGSGANLISNNRSSSYDFNWAAWSQFSIPQPYSGAVSLGPLAFWLLQAISTSAQMMYLGSFPNVRICSMEGYIPGNIISYASEDWMIFPMLRDTPWSQMQLADVVSSGRSGFAFKKVV